MREDVFKAALAGLLHDIGKFAQRAGERGTADSETARLDFGYYHALLTYDVISKLATDALAGEVKKLQRAAGYHHRPQDDLGAIVQLADHLASGNARPSQRIYLSL